MSLARAQVLRVFVADPAAEWHGYALMQETGFASGKMYPVLAALTRAGILIREEESIDTVEAGRPKRFLYRLSPEGAEIARYELAVLSEQLSVRSPRPGPLRPEGNPA